ncbi:MAG TPA: 6,7-dimethyl-8-ribityllumazine synthase, partial [Acidimicrobiales bacterium]|nr:6,7-dimethyl-8-ribityllumazine synthase [Acidimicrobiales bacterium]
MTTGGGRRRGGSGRRPGPTDGPAATYQGEPRGTGLRVAVVVSRFNEEVTGELLAGARDELVACGVDPASIVVASVPGAFELPLAAQRLARSGEVDAVV